MRKEIRIAFFLSLIVLGCSTKTQTTKPTPAITCIPSSITISCFPEPSETPHEEYTPEPSPPPPTLNPEYVNYEEYKMPQEYDYLGKKVCIPLNEKALKPELRYPIDLAVKSDGSEVYVITRNCVGKGYSSQGIILKDCNYSNPKDRRFIYKIKNMSKIELLNINDEYPLSCNLGEDIEIDNKNQLYFTDSLNNIYKTANNNYYNINLKYDSDEQLNINKYIGSIKLLINSNNEIYFKDLLYGQRESWGDYQVTMSIFRIHHDLLIKNIAITGHNDNTFAIYKDKILINYYYFDKYKYIPIAPKDKLIEKIGFESGVSAIRINSKGEIFLASYYNHSIWKVDKFQNIERVGGNGKAGFMDGLKENSQFNQPTALSFDKYDNLYVADQGNHAIRKITPEGIVSTFYKEK